MSESETDSILRHTVTSV